MNTIIRPSRSGRRRRADGVRRRIYRKPSYDCREQPDEVKLLIYVPGVDASGVEIEVRGPDLVVTAHKPHVVRINWQALNLEASQHDYRLRLRLGHGVDYDRLNAQLHDGVLTVRMPKRQPAGEPPGLRHVA